MGKYILIESTSEIAYNNKSIVIITYDIERNSNDANEIKAMMPTLWQILIEAYRGDIKGCDSAQKLYRNSDVVRVAYYKKQIVAAAFYRNTETERDKRNNKLMYCGAVRNGLHDIGVLAVDAIVKRDSSIENLTEHNWVEASGKLEYWFKQHKAFMLPKQYASEILNKEVDTSTDDDYHYYRIIGKENNKVLKMIFGASNDGIINQVAEECYGQLNRDVRMNYEKMISIQNLSQVTEARIIDENDNPAAKRYAYAIYDCIEEAVNYNEIYEMPEEILKCLSEAREVLAKHIYTPHDKRDLELCDELLNFIQPFKVINKRLGELVDTMDYVA